MLDMGWTEILVIGVVALIVVGPKDLPRMMRTVGQYAGKLRGMAREFQRSMEEAARQGDLDEFKDISKTLSDVRSIQNDAKSAIRKGLNDIDRKVGKVEKSVDLKVEDIDETAPSLKAKSEPEKTEPATSEPATSEPAKPESAAPEAAKAESVKPGPATAAPAEQPEPAKEPATVPTPEPRTASGP